VWSRSGRKRPQRRSSSRSRCSPPPPATVWSRSVREC
jgi:hypothetical protein